VYLPKRILGASPTRLKDGADSSSSSLTISANSSSRIILVNSSSLIISVSLQKLRSTLGSDSLWTEEYLQTRASIPTRLPLKIQEPGADLQTRTSEEEWAERLQGSSEALRVTWASSSSRTWEARDLRLLAGKDD